MSIDGHAAVAEGLFTMTQEGPRLIGSACASCGTRYFPQAVSCRNPACREKAITPVHLPSVGTLLSYTIQRYQPPPLFRMDDWKPYAIGLVDLGEGVEVMGMLTGIDLDAIHIGMMVELVLEALYHDDELGAVLTYKFAPLENSA